MRWLLALLAASSNNAFLALPHVDFHDIASPNQSASVISAVVSSTDCQGSRHTTRLFYQPETGQRPSISSNSPSSASTSPMIEPSLGIPVVGLAISDDRTFAGNCTSGESWPKWFNLTTAARHYLACMGDTSVSCSSPTVDTQSYQSPFIDPSYPKPLPQQIPVHHVRLPHNSPTPPARDSPEQPFVFLIFVFRT